VARAEEAETQARARIVADYIAGVADRYALDEHRRLFDLYH
jgi:dGTPase